MTVRDIFYLLAPAEVERADGERERGTPDARLSPWSGRGRLDGRPGEEGAMIVFQDVHDADRPNDPSRIQRALLKYEEEERKSERAALSGRQLIKCRGIVLRRRLS